MYEGPLRRGFPTPIIEIKAATSDRPVVNWQGFDDGSVPAECHRANALLIAAAPDMFEALNLLCDRFHTFAGQPFETDDGDPWAVAPTALAKARGA